MEIHYPERDVVSAKEAFIAAAWKQTAFKETLTNRQRAVLRHAEPDDVSLWLSEDPTEMPHFMLYGVIEKTIPPDNASVHIALNRELVDRIFRKMPQLWLHVLITHAVRKRMEDVDLRLLCARSSHERQFLQCSRAELKKMADLLAEPE